MKKKFAIKQKRTDLFLIFEVDTNDEKTLVDDTCQYIYEVDKFIEMNNGIIVEKEMLKEVKNNSDQKGLLFN